MKRTRFMFVLTGNHSDIQQVLDSVHFKGLTVLNAEDVSTNSILKNFANNKSIIFPQVTTLEYDYANVIHISVGIDNPTSSDTMDYINISKGNISNQLQQIASIHNCDIGDLKSNSSGLNGAPQIADCAYCNFLKGIDKYNQHPFYSSPRFFVVPTLGQFISGYPLIIPKEHVMSCAEFNQQTMMEFLEVLDDVLFILEKTYHTSKFLVWENGTGNGGKGKAKDSVVHSHVHIAPSNLTADIIEVMSGFSFKKIFTEEISQYSAHSYLMIKDGDNWRINDNPHVYIPRQYIRQLLAMEYQIPGEQWNWRTHPFTNEMNQSTSDIQNAMRLNWNNLSSRIKSRIVF